VVPADGAGNLRDTAERDFPGAAIFC
jgi:hypothetical protein